MTTVTVVTLNQTNDSRVFCSFFFAEVTSPEAVTMSATVTVTPTVKVYPSPTNPPTSGMSQKHKK